MANELFTGAAGRLGHATHPATSGRSARSRCRSCPAAISSAGRPPTSSAGSRRRAGSCISDVAGLLKGLTTGAHAGTSSSPIVLFFGVGYLLWRTPFGLRLRSAGERPSAADSLGVTVYRDPLHRHGRSPADSPASAARVLVLFANRYQENSGRRPRLPRPRHAGRRQLATGRHRRRRRAVRLLPGHHAAHATRASSCSRCCSRPRSRSLFVAIWAIVTHRPGRDRRVLVFAGLGVRARTAIADRAEQPVRLHHAVPRHADRRVDRVATAATAGRGRHPVAQGRCNRI